VGVGVGQRCVLERDSCLCPNGQDDLKSIVWREVNDICHVKTTAARPNNLFKSSLKETRHEHRADNFSGDSAVHHWCCLHFDTKPEMGESATNSEDSQWYAPRSVGTILG
jgi:hypothetical protein